MDGNETQNEIDRELVFDVIFKEGAMSPGEIEQNTGLKPARISKLVQHEWFTKMHGLIYIATVNGVRKGSVLIGSR